jgi:hypothetical protein
LEGYEYPLALLYENIGGGGAVGKWGFVTMQLALKRKTHSSVRKECVFLRVPVI